MQDKTNKEQNKRRASVGMQGCERAKRCNAMGCATKDEYGQIDMMERSELEGKDGLWTEESSGAGALLVSSGIRVLDLGGIQMGVHQTDATITRR